MGPRGPNADFTFTYILSELYNFYAFTAVEKHNEYQNKIEF